eukprot:3470537-Pyramimonas_sp.AAC.1
MVNTTHSSIYPIPAFYLFPSLISLCAAVARRLRRPPLSALTLCSLLCRYASAFPPPPCFL